jgi:predicted enzyme related to lactoylglutathione lyase
MSERNARSATSEASTGPAAGGLRVTEVVIDCADHSVVVAFWSAALGWEAHPVNDQYVALAPSSAPGAGAAGGAGDPDGSVPAILFQKVPERKTGKNRVHLDFAAPEMTAEVERLVGLGATVIAHRSLGDFAWTVLADPEGNEFCVSQG